MYCTTTATREKALKASTAAERAMKRHECSKSQFKFECFSCGEMINRGDKITKCTAPCWDGMRLRFRGADSRNGLKDCETAFYLAETGTRTWVHIGCIPCYWDSLPTYFSNEYSRPSLRPIYTDWGVKVYGEWEEWCGSQHIDHDHFCLMKGYPKEKFMRDRIVHAVTRFQAIWRGYLFKQAYPIALQQHYEKLELAREQRFARCRELLKTAPEVGDHVEILFNAKEPSESIYSAEVIEVQYRGRMGIKIKVKFHYDGEVRKYTGEKFNLLKKECEEHKKIRGIEAKLTGKLYTYHIGKINWHHVYSNTCPSN